eukprot:m.258910 g.258910  ORF g.258910 m.258910 type:complete len:89 (-) comp26630_c2_seq9:936-1202(-)
MADSDAAKMAQIEAEIQKTLHEIDQLNAAYEKNRTDILDRPLVATKGENLVLLRKQLDRLQAQATPAPPGGGGGGGGGGRFGTEQAQG